MWLMESKAIFCFYLIDKILIYFLSNLDISAKTVGTRIRPLLQELNEWSYIEDIGPVLLNLLKKKSLG